MKKYVKHKNLWWEYVDQTPKTDATLKSIKGKYSEHNDISQYKIIEAEDFKSLDWNGTEILNNSYDYGWLDRDGNFFGCNYEYHDLQARLIHNSTLKELEKIGWIHIAKDLISKSGKAIAEFYADYYDKSLSPTDKQIEYLLNHKNVNAKEVFYKYEQSNKTKIDIFEDNYMKTRSKKIIDDDDKVM